MTGILRACSEDVFTYAQHCLADLRRELLVVGGRSVLIGNVRDEERDMDAVRNHTTSARLLL